MQSQVSVLLTEAAQLMVVGMLVVFLFLSLLIGAIKLLAWVCMTYLPQSSPIEAPTHQGSQDNLKPDVIAAISAAIHRYRQSK